ncbi:hypothetical protein OOU_Y34scaffold00062g9 [Pyricularia oryzae Y34]|uniref:Uncharacterized protein n=3 Tax=Pyricularia oryzae TaxID=318829 RepID=A0AA97PAP0_PYRO3|nr:hypothetical protein OOU_Y34scaffold00062g9 [Pyricularia oryzae Y34]
MLGRANQACRPSASREEKQYFFSPKLHSKTSLALAQLYYN